MSAQNWYEQANAELDFAVMSDSQGDSTNHATLACAYYLRAITEMLGTKFKQADQEPLTSKGNT